MPDKSKSPCCSASRNAGNGIKRSIITPTEHTLVNSGSPVGMAYISGGTFAMGTDDTLGYPSDGEGPIRDVHLKPYYIDTCSVTNTQFRKFVQNTGYVTEAEHYGWSFVFKG